jgi:hypothetical protein
MTTVTPLKNQSCLFALAYESHVCEVLIFHELTILFLCHDQILSLVINIDHLAISWDTFPGQCRTRRLCQWPSAREEEGAQTPIAEGAFEQDI